MGTTADKLAYLNDTKTAIKNAIVAKGVDVPEGTTFREYAGKIGEISGDSSWVSSLADAVKQNSDVVLLSEPHECVSVFGDMYELSELNDGYYVVMFEAVEDGKQIIFTSPGFGFGFDYISSPAKGDGYMFDTYNSNISMFSWQNFGYKYGFSLEPYSGRPCYMYVPKGAVVVYERM